MQRVAELHIQEARHLALGIFAGANVVVPAPWAGMLGEKIVMDAYKFAAHARHLSEITELNFGDIMNADRTGSDISMHKLAFQKSYAFCLNSILHAKTLEIKMIDWTGEQHWEHVKNIKVSFLDISTDLHPQPVHISLYGLTLCFLDEVIPRIQKHYPAYRI